MANENVQPQPAAVEPAQPSTPAQSQAPVSAPVEEKASGSAPATQAPAAEVKPKFDKFNGDFNTVPPEFADYAKSMRRYLTTVTQESANYKKAAERLAALEKDPRVAQLLQSPSGQANPTPPQQQEPELYVDPDTQQFVERTKAQLEEQVKEIQRNQIMFQKQQELAAFAEANPKFWEYDQLGLMGAAIREIVDTGQGTLHDAYARLQEVENKFRQDERQRVLAELNSRTAEKQNAVSTPPSNTNEPGVYWVENEQQSRDKAFELALQGKRAEVKIRPKNKKP